MPRRHRGQRPRRRRPTLPGWAPHIHSGWVRGRFRIVPSSVRAGTFDLLAGGPPAIYGPYLTAELAADAAKGFEGSETGTPCGSCDGDERGRAARRLKGKQRQRAALLGSDDRAVVVSRYPDLKPPRAVLAPYAEQHPLLYHLAGGEVDSTRGGRSRPRTVYTALAGPEIEALFLAAGWVQKAERGKLSRRALLRRLARLERRLEQVMADDLEPSSDFEPPWRPRDEAEEEVGEEESLWRGEQAKRLFFKDATDRWRDGEPAHLASRGLVVDKKLLADQIKTWRGRIGHLQGWSMIDGRPVRYAEGLPGSSPYPDHTWIDPVTRRTYPGRKHPYQPALYADTGDPVPRYHEIAPAPVYGPDTPTTWRRRTRKLRAVMEDIDPRRRHWKSWGRPRRR